MHLLSIGADGCDLIFLVLDRIGRDPNGFGVIGEDGFGKKVVLVIFIEDFVPIRPDLLGELPPVAFRIRFPAIDALSAAP
jgi:hypothetical protein